MTDHIVKFDGDEGRDRSTSPSLNAPHSYDEALVAVLMKAHRDLRAAQRTQIERRNDKYPTFWPKGSETQQKWLTQAYADAVQHLQLTIEGFQQLMRREGEDATKYD